MIALLLRFFPARWRARYGDEFAAMLEERPLGPFDVADVLLAALDAHLHRHGLAAVPHSTGGITMSLRIGGYSAITGGALWFSGLAYASADAATGSATTSPIAMLILVVGNAALLVALAGLSAFQARRYPRLTWAAFILPAFGAVAAIIGVVGLGTIGDRPFIAGLSPWYVWALGSLALVIGSAIFAGVTWRTAALSRRSAALLGLSVLVSVPVFLGVAGAIVPAAVGPVAMIVCLFLFAAGWVAVGWSALRLGRGPVAAGGAT